MNSSAYEHGKVAALNAYGVRTAAEIGRMPDGPEHLGASRFAKLIGGDAPSSEQARRQNPLDRETVWGPAASVEAGGVSNNDLGLRSGAV